MKGSRASSLSRAQAPALMTVLGLPTWRPGGGGGIQSGSFINVSKGWVGFINTRGPQQIRFCVPFCGDKALGLLGWDLRESFSGQRSMTLCIIGESIDSLCRDGADTPMPPYI